MVKIARTITDPLIQQVYNLLEEERAKESPRKYLGASSIGDPCERKLWYRLNQPEKAKPANAKLILSANDGHRSEEIMADLLRRVPGVKLSARESLNLPYRFSDMGGKFAGHLDGIIEGIPLAPKVTHVWENKSCNETKFKKLLNIKETVDDDRQLEAWDEKTGNLYYAQAQIYMHYLDIPRHYMTVCLSGTRDFTTIRTPYNKDIAINLIEKADRIITYKAAPLGVSQNPDFYLCKMCEFKDYCHGK